MISINPVESVWPPLLLRLEARLCSSVGSQNRPHVQGHSTLNSMRIKQRACFPVFLDKAPRTVAERLDDGLVLLSRELLFPNKGHPRLCI